MISRGEREMMISVRRMRERYDDIKGRERDDDIKGRERDDDIKRDEHII